MTTTTLAPLHVPTPDSVYEEGRSKCQSYTLGSLTLKSWRYGHSGRTATQADAHGVSKVQVFDLYPERGDDSTVSVEFKNDDDAEVTGFLTVDAARKLRDQLNELDL